VGRPARRRPGRAAPGPRLERLEGHLAPAVSFAISDPAPLPEGDTGTSDMMFVVTRSGGLGPAVQVEFATRDGTAVAGTDYVATGGTLRFAPGQATATVAVSVIGNTVLQSDRTFGVVLSDPLVNADFAPSRPFPPAASRVRWRWRTSTPRTGATSHPGLFPGPTH
jgi:hypothetical protein